MNKRAAAVYRWLWLSPLLTIPSFMVLVLQDFGRQMICGSGLSGCNRTLALSVGIIFSALVSGSWHLLFLRKAFDGRANPFVRWHSRQALFLAGIRTAVPVFSGLAFGASFETLWAVPLLGAVWLFGTRWGQSQARRGDCWLLDTLGSEDDPKVMIQAKKRPKTSADQLLNELNSRTSLTRQNAAIRLANVGESSGTILAALRKTAKSDPNPYVREKASEALQARVHRQFQSSVREVEQIEKPTESIRDPGSAYEAGLSLLESGKSVEAIAQFTFAFRRGDAAVHDQALERLEQLDEVEVF
jgi:hypothetical protein